MVSLVSNAPTLPVTGAYAPAASPSALVSALQNAAGVYANQQLPEAVAATAPLLANASDLPQQPKTVSRNVVNGAANGLMAQILMQQGEMTAEDAAVFAPSTALAEAPEEVTQALISNVRQQGSDAQGQATRTLPSANPASAQATLRAGPIKLASTYTADVPPQRFTLPGRKPGLSDAKGASAYAIITQGTFMVKKVEGIEAAL